ncbi:MAG: tRNA(Ile)-lysidine synthetase, partial [Bacteroidaceae bacterium]|nr:tRNA(Ile)-lysidine synthetase [Bacteroidaceae bacterium]
SDVLTNRKINRFQRERQHVLCCGEDIVWLIGIQADNRFRVTDKTTRIVQISIK